MADLPAILTGNPDPAELPVLTVPDPEVPANLSAPALVAQLTDKQSDILHLQ